MATVYRHIRLDVNKVFYIGIGKSDKRAYDKNGRNQYWKNIVNSTDYRVDILFDDLTWEEACEKEKEFISLYGRIDLGKGTLVNLTDGGEGSNGAKRKYTNNKPSPLKGRKYTLEHRMAQSKAQKNHKWNIGKGRGYIFDAKTGKYRVRVCLNKKNKHIGCFEDAESAYNAYVSFWNEYKIKNNLK